MQERLIDHCKSPEQAVCLQHRLELSGKAQISIGWSPAMQEMIEAVAYSAVAANEIHGDLFTQATEDIRVFGNVIGIMQADLLQEKHSEVFTDLPKFYVQPNNLSALMDCYTSDDRDEGYFLMPASINGSPNPCLTDRRHFISTVAHEHLHHVQRHMERKLADSTIASSHPLYDDAMALAAPDRHRIRPIPLTVIDNEDLEAPPGRKIRIAAGWGLYSSTVREQAAYALSDMVEALLDKTPPARPQPNTKTMQPTARPSRAPR